MIKTLFVTLGMGIFSIQAANASVLIDIQGSPLGWSSSAGASGGATASGAINVSKHALRGTLAFQIPIGLYLGGSYSSISNGSTTEEFVNGVSGGDTSTASFAEYGPTLGFAKNGFNLGFTYCLGTTFTSTDVNKNNSGTVTSDQTQRFQKGSGFQISFSYTFALFSKVRLGPALLYRSSTYEEIATKNNLSGAAEVVTALTTKAKFDGITPMINLVIDL
ncbi:MAG: hypothetical protein JNL01_01825 [Bdellovibrionales bacterium]|nr:hypothetical protein [Bdellovibrionales bacterium]